MAKISAQRAGSTSHVWGYVIVLFAALAFISSMYVMVFSKLMLLLPLPTTEIAQQANMNISLISSVERDVYYCYLVPLTIPVTIVACYANWVSLKFFRHN
ncbi:putative phosphatidylinositol N-acetylglucosaminyltransferase subunit Y [Plasmopara halstedii]